MNKKVILLVTVFLLLIPFRLPVNIFFIKTLIGICELTGDLNETIIVMNIIATKAIYSLILSGILVYLSESISRDLMKIPKLDSKEVPLYWYNALLSLILFAYCVYDGIMTYELYFILK